MKKVVILILGIISFNLSLFGNDIEIAKEAYLKGDYAKANELYKKACDNGNMHGCTNLGIVYENGLGVKQDYTKANELYKKSCDGDDVEGCTNLGALYAKGQGVKQDYTKASELFKKACDNGDAEGCSNLGILYANEQGVKQDYVTIINEDHFSTNVILQIVQLNDFCFYYEENKEQFFKRGLDKKTKCEDIKEWLKDNKIKIIQD